MVMVLQNDGTGQKMQWARCTRWGRMQKAEEIWSERGGPATEGMARVERKDICMICGEKEILIVVETMSKNEVE